MQTLPRNLLSGNLPRRLHHLDHVGDYQRIAEGKGELAAGGDGKEQPARLVAAGLELGGKPAAGTVPNSRYAGAETKPG